MVRKFIIPVLIILTLLISACNLNITTTPPPAPSNTPVIPTVTSIPSTPLPTNTAVSTLPPPAPTDTLAPTLEPTVAVPSVSVPASTSYIDDRSTASQVIVSYYDAINRQQYSRAYGYYSDPATDLGNFSSFASGYSTTASVDLVFGAISGDPGMSQVYYTIPVVLKVTASNSTHTNYSACYVVHETNPDVYGGPPVDPMSIYNGSAVQVSLNASDASLLATACNNYPTGGNPPFPASGNGLNIDQSNFVDNRSGAIETVSSFLNALNLKQYARAYSYFQVHATYPGPYDPWAAGYANTDTIAVTFGTVQSEGAAGSTYYKVPLAQKVVTTSSTKLTFVGCFTLRLAQPANQTTPPFQSMGIVSGKFNQVSNSIDVNTLLPTACN